MLRCFTSQARCVHWCNSGTDVMGVTNCYGFRFKGCTSEGILRKTGTLNLVKSLQLGMLQALKGSLLLLFCYIDRVLNCLLSIYGYLYQLVLPSTLARETSLCSGQQLMQRLITGEVPIECSAVSESSLSTSSQELKNWPSPNSWEEEHKEHNGS